MTKPDTQPDLTGYEIVVGVTGGIAAYKVCYLVSNLVQHAAGVTVVMTEAGARFVGPTTFQALTARSVLTSVFSADHPHDPQHIGITRRADLFLIAPATANIIGKIATGICDDLVSTMVVASSCPVMFAPAMNSEMWRHPAVQANVERLRSFGYGMIGPAEGWLACRDTGPGRMSEPREIFARVAEQLRAARPKNTG